MMPSRPLMKKLLFATLAIAAASAMAQPNSAAGIAGAQEAAPSAAVPTLQIDAGKVTGKVSPTLYGLMTEEINFSYEGGLYAELIRNRTFKAERAESGLLERRWRRGHLARPDPAAQLRVEREPEAGREQGLGCLAGRDCQRRFLGDSRAPEHDLSRLVLRPRDRISPVR